MTDLRKAREAAAAAAVVAFVTAKDSRRRKRDGGASIVDPAKNPDLRDDLVDLVADVLLWARARGLDADYIARVGASHAEPAAAADDEAVTAAASGFARLQPVALSEDWHGVPAGTPLIVVARLKPAEEGGLYSGAPYQVQREDRAMLPGPFGPSGSAVIDAKYLRAR